MDNPYQIPDDFLEALRESKRTILNLRTLSIKHLDKTYGPLGLNFCRWFLKDLSLFGRNLSLDEFRQPPSEEPIQLYMDEGE